METKTTKERKGQPPFLSTPALPGGWGPQLKRLASPRLPAAEPFSVETAASRVQRCRGSPHRLPIRWTTTTTTTTTLVGGPRARSRVVAFVSCRCRCCFAGRRFAIRFGSQFAFASTSAAWHSRRAGESRQGSFFFLLLLLPPVVCLSPAAPFESFSSLEKQHRRVAQLPCSRMKSIECQQTELASLWRLTADNCLGIRWRTNQCIENGYEANVLRNLAAVPLSTWPKKNNERRLCRPPVCVNAWLVERFRFSFLLPSPIPWIPRDFFGANGSDRSRLIIKLGDFAPEIIDCETSAIWVGRVDGNGIPGSAESYFGNSASLGIGIAEIFSLKASGGSFFRVAAPPFPFSVCDESRLISLSPQKERRNRKGVHKVHSWKTKPKINRQKKEFQQFRRCRQPPLERTVPRKNRLGSVSSLFTSFRVGHFECTNQFENYQPSGRNFSVRLDRTRGRCGAERNQARRGVPRVQSVQSPALC